MTGLEKYSSSNSDTLGTQPNSRLFWGKYDEKTGEIHALVCHLVDTAAVAGAIWDHVISPQVRAILSGFLNLEPDNAKKWIEFFCALHDLGKATSVFQGKVAELKVRLEKAGFPFAPGDTGHGLLSASFLVNPYQRNQLPILKDLPPGLAILIGYSIGGHHGTFPQSNEIFDKVRLSDIGTGVWNDARTDLVSTIGRVLGLDGEEMPSGDWKYPGPFFFMLSGLISVSDWIASNERFYTPTELPEDLNVYARRASETAAREIERMHLTSGVEASSERTFAEAFPQIQELRPIQTAVSELATELKQPGLVIIEAPMGEGKTEAALYLAERWNATLKRGGLYIGMPTQATSNQMFKRVRTYLGRIETEHPLNIALIQGNVILSDEYQQLIVKSSASDAVGSAIVAEEWFTYKKRGLLSPFGVGTVDQALLAVLPSRHFFVRLFGLAGKTIIIDEVHAYDTYMTTLFESLMTWAAALGSNVILLSATLTSSRRRKLLSAYSGCKVLENEGSYPRISISSGNEVRMMHVPASSRWHGGSDVSISIDWIEDTPETIYKWVDARISTGGRIAIIQNTVERCRDIFLYIKEKYQDSDIDIDLFHARYPFRSRDQRERECISKYGDKNRNPRKKSIIVATQVIEQSLDLDFDAMVTDIAPSDLILQRIGRVHRHELKRPELLSEPQVAIVRPSHDVMTAFPAFNESRYIYDEYILTRSYIELSSHKAIALPSDIESIVERTYSEELLANLSEPFVKRIRHLKAAMEKTQGNDKSEAYMRLITQPKDGQPWTSSGRRLFEDEPEAHRSLQAMTRLAPPSVDVICFFSEGRSDTDPWFLDTTMQRRYQPESEHSLDLTKELLQNSLSLSDWRIVELLKSMNGIPPRWKMVAMLRGHRPLVFTGKAGGRAFRHDEIDWSITFDVELGVFISQRGKHPVQPD